MSFQALMDELGLMAKAQNGGADGGDGKIDAAAAAGGDTDAGAGAAAGAAGTDGAGTDTGASGADAGAAGTDGGAAAAAGTDGDGDGDNDLGKSFSFTLEDGNVVEAIDGTALVKALMERQERGEADVTKALGMTVDLIKSLQTQVGALQTQVGKLASSGTGRKAVLSVSERPSVLRKSQEEEGIPAGEFLAKCLVAQAAGKITAADVSRAESYVNHGLQVPAEIVARVVKQ